MRVSYGVQWVEDVETAIKVLGRLVYQYTSEQKAAQLLEEK